MTNSELIAEIRKPGKIEMPVLTAHDVTHVIVEKGDLIDLLRDREPDAEAVWALYPSHRSGVRRLDVA